MEMKGATIMAFVIILLVAVAPSVYLKREYDAQLTQQQQEITSLKEEHTAQIAALNTLIQNLDEQNTKNMQTLTSLVKQTQRESSAKFSQLEDELKGISIEAGDFSVVIQDALKGVVSIITDKGQGSGTIVARDGYLITNYHVIQDASQLAIITYDKKIHAGALVAKDKINDIAVLKILTNATFHDLPFGNSDQVKVGEKVVALGNPAGLGFTATQGIISQKDRMVSGNIGLLQTDVAINPGNSGGPLINSAGKVIGIMRAKVKGYESLGFAIPSNAVAARAEELADIGV